MGGASAPPIEEYRYTKLRMGFEVLSNIKDIVPWMWYLPLG
jgi:hypothetical protein